MSEDEEEDEEEDGSSEMSEETGEQDDLKVEAEAAIEDQGYEHQDVAVGPGKDEEEDEEVEEKKQHLSEAKMMDLETRLKEAKEEEGAPKATPMPNLMTQLRAGAKGLKPPEKQNEKHLSIEQGIKQLNASASRPDTV